MIELKTIGVLLVATMVIDACIAVNMDFIETNSMIGEGLENVILSSKTIWVDNDFVDDPPNHKWDTIGKGVNDADDGDTVHVFNGTYYEQVKIDKTISLIGENRYSTYIEGWHFTGYVVELTADWVTVSGFTVLGAPHGKGIFLNYSSNCVIANNFVSTSDSGIFLSHSSNNTIVNNDIVMNSVGISLAGSTGNTIYHNNFIENTPVEGLDTDPFDNNWYHPALLEGNHWSLYQGVDNGGGTGKHAIAGDGIGDTEIPHPAPGFDFYPFTERNSWKEEKGVPPVADAGGPYVEYEGSAIEFDASNSSCPKGSALEYRWDFENDGTWDTNWSSEPTATYTYFDDFVGEVAVEARRPFNDTEDVVHDYSNGFFTWVHHNWSLAQSFTPEESSLSKVSLTIAVDKLSRPGMDLFVSIRKTLNGTNLTSTSLPPESFPDDFPCGGFVDFDFPDISVVPGDTYFIVLTTPKPPGAPSGSYTVCGAWVDYPDGTVWRWDPVYGWNELGEHGDLMFKTYSGAGYLLDTDVANVTIYNVPPVVEWTSKSNDGSIANPPYPEGKEIAFESTVYDPGTYDTFTYDWDFGDGTVLMDAGPSVIHAYGDNDTYIVVLTVTDDDGGVGIDDTPPLLTTNENPIASAIMPACIFVEGTSPCELVGEFTDPGWLDTHSAVWNFGDGTYETAVITEENNPPDATGMNTTSHIYGDNGVYNISFTVVDDDGGVSTDWAEAHVQNLPPSFALDVPSSVNEGEDFLLEITASDPGSDDLIIDINWGDGGSESMTYYNNGMGPDPPNSGQGIFPFTVHENFTHVYGDNGNFTIKVSVGDDDGAFVENNITAEVLNLPPEITLPSIPLIFNEGEEFTLLAKAQDPGSDDIEFTWDLELGPSFSAMYYNDGVAPDPPLSPWGTFPFFAQDSVNHTYGDNGAFNVTITATDDDGSVTIQQTIVTIENVAPTIESVNYYLNASFLFRIAGEKWHNVEIHLYEDNTEIGYADITRYPGSPNDQMVAFGNVSIDFSSTYSAIAYYTPEDDPINGQIQGATPAWVIIQYQDGEERIHHTFNVNHQHTWTWEIEDFSPYFLGHNITFVATASDPGSDDLIFTWDWGDGNSTEHIYYNDGVSPDPYPSPDVNPIAVRDTAKHAYDSSGSYAVTLTVADDDGGFTTLVLTVYI